MSEEEDLYDIEAELLKAMAAQSPVQEYRAYAGEELKSGESLASKEDIITAIRLVSDPEIMINVYDLGLIYDIRQEQNGDVEIDMSLTSPTCPVAGILPQEVADEVAKISGVGVVCVLLVWEPAWSPELLTQEAKDILEIY